MPNAYTRTRITLTETERAALTSMARSRSLPAALALRERIVLACEGDRVSTDVAAQLGINRGAVTRWRGRYAHLRIAGLYDELRPGRPRTVDNERVAELIAKTLHTNGHVSSFDSPFFAATSSVAFWPESDLEKSASTVPDLVSKSSEIHSIVRVRQQHAGWPGFITRSTCAHIRTRYDLTPMAPDAGAHIAREIEMPTRATSRLIQTCASLSNGDSASALNSAKGVPRNPRPTTYATAREKASVSLIKSRKDGGRARNVSCLTRRPPCAALCEPGRTALLRVRRQPGLGILRPAE